MLMSFISIGEFIVFELSRDIDMWNIYTYKYNAYHVFISKYINSLLYMIIYVYIWIHLLKYIPTIL